VAVVLSKDKEVDNFAVRFLITHLNTIQSAFEYEIITFVDTLLDGLEAGEEVDREEIRKLSAGFTAGLAAFYEDQNREYRLKEPVPPYSVVIGLATFSDSYYSMRQGRVSVIAPGNWRRQMAPPSLLEFILTLIVRESVAAVSPTLRGSVHLGTKGCLLISPRL
jgi:hypothetical protein